MARYLRIEILAIFALLACGGCSSGDGRLSVSGTVVDAAGNPIGSESSEIAFSPAAGGGQAASGILESDGTFTLAPDDKGQGGVLPGEYKVVVRVRKSYRDLTLTSPEAYAEAATTPLSATVDADHTEFEFVVE
ncbi:MAG: hypothetical protein CMJ58_05910 [Planctomycetaceae bacterium]|nr:hypothetical protein [Planctomycetaceae bacterium]